MKQVIIKCVMIGGSVFFTMLVNNMEISKNTKTLVLEDKKGPYAVLAILESEQSLKNRRKSQEQTPTDRVCAYRDRKKQKLPNSPLAKYVRNVYKEKQKQKKEENKLED